MEPFEFESLLLHWPCNEVLNRGKNIIYFDYDFMHVSFVNLNYSIRNLSCMV